jgi:hypothetical protein
MPNPDDEDAEDAEALGDELEEEPTSSKASAMFSLGQAWITEAGAK